MIQEIFAKNLRQFREATGMSQGQLGKKAGYSRKSINYYENCRRVPDILFLEDIAAALGKAPVEMITERKET